MADALTRWAVRLTLVAVIGGALFGVVKLGREKVVVGGGTSLLASIDENGPDPNSSFSIDNFGYPLPWEEWTHGWAHMSPQIIVSKYQGRNWMLCLSALLLAGFGPIAVLSKMPRIYQVIPGWLGCWSRWLTLSGIGGLLAATVVFIFLRMPTFYWGVSGRPSWYRFEYVVSHSRNWLNSHNVSFSWPLYNLATLGGMAAAVITVVLLKRLWNRHSRTVCRSC